MAVETTTVRVEQSRPTAYVCDYCGCRNEEYAQKWWFLPPGWISLVTGGDPAYAKRTIMCHACAVERDL